MVNKWSAVFLLCGALFFGACSTTKTLQQTTLSDADLYQQAIQNSIYPDSSKLFDGLVAINNDNKNLVWKTIDNEEYILVVTWKQNISFYKPYLDSAYYNTGKYPIWITTAPELQNRMKAEKVTNVNRRLIELLGLPPNATYSYFVEFWVKPSDLFRPCPDAEITDTKCDLCFPANVSKEHQNWINENRISRYYQCDLYNQYPWSQLGYTYDWNPNNTNHVGLSEFVIPANKNIVVKAIYTTEEYLQK